jgi:hypothetical protein
LNADVHIASIHTQRRQTVDRDIGDIAPVFANRAAAATLL